jgi:hypothetical protein
MQVCATKARRRATKESKASTPRQPTPKPAQTAQPPPQLPPVTATDHNNGPSEIIVPQILPTDYETDMYLKDIYLYLTQGLLTGSDDQDRATLLLAEDFFVDQNSILYRISLQRGKKASRVQSTEIRLALPQIYLAEVVEKSTSWDILVKRGILNFCGPDFMPKTCMMLWLDISSHVTDVNE